jgi:hypothetical protein
VKLTREAEVTEGRPRLLQRWFGKLQARGQSCGGRNIGYSTPSSIILMEKVEKLDGLAA